MNPKNFPYNFNNSRYMLPIGYITDGDIRKVIYWIASGSPYYLCNMVKGYDPLPIL